MNAFPEPSVATGGASFEALLQAAVGATAEAVEVARSGDDVRALRCVAALDQALDEIVGLASAVPAVLSAAFPGAAVESVLREKLDAAERVARAVRNHRAQLDQLAAAESQLRQTAAEHEVLRQRVAELRRLERAAEVLPRLAVYRGLVEERVTALSAPVQAAESALARVAGELAPLDADVLSRLTPRLRELGQQTAERLAAVARAEADLAELDQQLAEARLRERELAELRERRLAALAEHSRADLAALDAIAGPGDGRARVGADLGRELDGVRAVLADVEARLEAADRALGRALAARSSLLAGGAARH